MLPLLDKYAWWASSPASPPPPQLPPPQAPAPQTPPPAGRPAGGAAPPPPPACALPGRLLLTPSRGRPLFSPSNRQQALQTAWLDM
jgi:hypothetical protein